MKTSFAFTRPARTLAPLALAAAAVELGVWQEVIVDPVAFSRAGGAGSRRDAQPDRRAEPLEDFPHHRAFADARRAGNDDELSWLGGDHECGGGVWLQAASRGGDGRFEQCGGLQRLAVRVVTPRFGSALEFAPRRF